MSGSKNTTSNRFMSSLDIHKLFSKKRRKKPLTIFMFVSIAFLICLLLAFFISSFWVDKNANSGSYKGKTEEQIIADLNAQVKDGEMNVSIANTIKFPDGSLNDGEAKIENISANHVDQVVELQLVNDGEVLYKSGAIEPGHYIQNIRLNKSLEPGAYRAKVLFTGYKRCEDGSFEQFIQRITNSHQKTGVIAAEVNLLVE